MDLMLEDLAHARINARLEEAESLRRGRRTVTALRLGRMGEAAARRARAALASNL